MRDPHDPVRSSPATEVAATDVADAPLGPGPLAGALRAVLGQAAGGAPAWESPSEEAFEARAAHLLAPGVRLRPQVEVPTRWATFRLDFVLERSAVAAAGLAGAAAADAGGGVIERVAVECDGPHHDPLRDVWRDALVLDSGAVDAILRFSTEDFHRHPTEVLAVLAALRPGVFSEHGRAQLRAAARIPDGVLAGPWSDRAVGILGPRLPDAPDPNTTEPEQWAEYEDHVERCRYWTGLRAVAVVHRTASTRGPGGRPLFEYAACARRHPAPLLDAVMDAARDARWYRAP